MAEIWNYETIKELLYAPGLGHYFTYGLLAARKINAAWEPVEFIHDVTTDYLLVKKMEELFNRYQLYPIHLRDAIEDMLPYDYGRENLAKFTTTFCNRVKFPTQNTHSKIV